MASFTLWFLLQMFSIACSFIGSGRLFIATTLCLQSLNSTSGLLFQSTLVLLGAFSSAKHPKYSLEDRLAINLWPQISHTMSLLMCIAETFGGHCQMSSSNLSSNKLTHWHWLPGLEIPGNIDVVWFLKPVAYVRRRGSIHEPWLLKRQL